MASKAKANPLAGWLALSCECGATARASLGNMKRFGRPEHCGGPMMPVDVNVAVEVLTDDELRSHPAYVEAMEAEVKRTIREVRRAANGRAQCGHCHKFVASKLSHCSCGWDNAAGQFVAHGGWSLAARDEIPF